MSSDEYDRGYMDGAVIPLAVIAERDAANARADAAEAQLAALVEALRAAKAALPKNSALNGTKRAHALIDAALDEVAGG